MTLSELRRSVENATEPDRKLDGMIWCAANGYEYLQWDGAGCRYNAKSMGHIDERHIGKFTGSIDAAAALLERLFPGEIWDVSSTGVAWVMHDDRQYSAKALTPALALVAAMVAAMEFSP